MQPAIEKIRINHTAYVNQTVFQTRNISRHRHQASLSAVKCDSRLISFTTSREDIVKPLQPEAKRRCSNV